jgi:putative nucleotidyltransferase with HDIG domain
MYPTVLSPIIMNLQTTELETSDLLQRPKINIEDLVEITMPPSPSSIIRISGLLRDVNTPMRKITEAVSYEPTLVMRILRLANSPIYGLERNVNSIQMAINTVGSKTLQDIVMMGLASSTFAKEIHSSPISRKIWEHSLAVATISRELSEMLKMQGTEESFTCGLLHDIGKLMLLSYDFAYYSTLLEEDDERTMLDSEHRQYGYDHAEVGSLIARRWSLQEEVCYSILYHHDPSRAAHPMMVAHIVEVADIIANIKGYGLRSMDESSLSNSESVTRLRLTEEDLKNAWNKVEKNIDEVIRTFA